MEISNVMVFAGIHLLEQEKENEPISEESLEEFLNARSEVDYVDIKDINEALARLLEANFIKRVGVSREVGNLFSRCVPENCLDKNHKGEKTMPVYEFKCGDCGKVFSIACAMDTVVHFRPTCPECDSKNVHRKYSGIGVIFKGEGFYVNDKAKQ